ncbi:Homocysteine-responsive endoplasmic reticulum-resident ubiquitin-like domain member 2 protein [Salmo salar]|uniref:Homocysteine-responsive endoplasmic reticulum-resident ubiquitin-like domain member 2 protein n=1 Tax=Salmo salar TaxID=8030 RepID=B9EPY6_SALSA|nr:Homocysteine-responsive endoplasmic reticulum-resident ubiquitin-like domain member 2 protein [Salmo salar]ACM09583.1 Homocysteine-responsive endoplasmic reticulum-resident ubiquitin-like domain member 2 protein [Salmo salar]|eukprot:NP_001140144.1 Homocysteine-responsive endoplasmic reticulum-resident ubiquitin-like domain member 2 protein [Salmo salar]
MDPGAVDSPVTLVIKAPNQKYDDQTINCFLNWTVEKLKSHISNVYPSKPVSGYCHFFVFLLKHEVMAVDEWHDNGP